MRRCAVCFEAVSCVFKFVLESGALSSFEVLPPFSERLCSNWMINIGFFVAHRFFINMLVS